MFLVNIYHHCGIILGGMLHLLRLFLSTSDCTFHIIKTVIPFKERSGKPDPHRSLTLFLTEQPAVRKRGVLHPVNGVNIFLKSKPMLLAYR
jgi:hypothetical protein